MPPASRSNSRRRQRAFTTIELVTVIVLFGIVGALAAPRFFDNSAFSQRGYIDELAGSLRYAQRVAIASQCEVRFTINAANYSAMQRAASGGTCNPAGAWNRPVVRTDGAALAGTAPASANAAPGAIVVFDAQGRLATGIPAMQTVGTFTLTIDPTTGAVTVQP